MGNEAQYAEGAEREQTNDQIATRGKPPWAEGDERFLSLNDDHLSLFSSLSLLSLSDSLPVLSLSYLTTLS